MSDKKRAQLMELSLDELESGEYLMELVCDEEDGWHEDSPVVPGLHSLPHMLH